MVNFKVGQLLKRRKKCHWWEIHGGNYTDSYKVVAVGFLGLNLKNMHTGCVILHASGLGRDYEIIDTELLKVKIW